MNILVISTEEYLTLRLLKCLAPLDAVIHIISAVPSPALRASRYCRRYSTLPLARPSETLCADINGYCRRHQIDVILPSGMPSNFLLAEITGCLEAPVLPITSPGQLRILNNKWTFSRLLEDLGLPYPNSRLIEQAQDVETLDLRFPVIVKPLDLDAGRGVARCDTPDAVAAHVARHSAALPLLVQEFIPGADVGLGILARQGEILAWSIQKQATDGSGIEFIAHEGILEIGQRLMSHLCYDGIAHFDLRLDARDGSVKALECNPRFWASLPFCMVAGVNYAELGIRLALGQPLPEVLAGQISLTFPSRALTGALRGQAPGWRISEPSRSALRFTLADPLPYVCLGAGRIGSKMKSLFANPPVSGGGRKTEATQ